MKKKFEIDLYCLLDKHFGDNQFEYANKWEDEEDGFYLQLWVWNQPEREEQV